MLKGIPSILTPELLKVQLTVHRGKSVYCAPESLTRMQRFN